MAKTLVVTSRATESNEESSEASWRKFSRVKDEAAGMNLLPIRVEMGQLSVLFGKVEADETQSFIGRLARW